MARGTEEVRVRKLIGNTEFELLIPVGGMTGEIAHISPRIPSNDLAPDVYEWACRVLEENGKKPQQSYYYSHPKEGEERSDRIPYGQLSILFIH